jgi:hypothetical protein
MPVVSDALNPADVSDRFDSGAADLPHTLRDPIRHRENLFGLLIEQQMVVAEMRPLICQ